MNSDHSPPSVVAGLKQLVACQLALPVNAVKLKKTRRVFDILLFGKRASADVRHICVHSGRVFLSIFFRPMLTHTLTLTHSHTHMLFRQASSENCLDHTAQSVETRGEESRGKLRCAAYQLRSAGRCVLVYLSIGLPGLNEQILSEPRTLINSKPVAK